MISCSCTLSALFESFLLRFSLHIIVFGTLVHVFGSWTFVFGSWLAPVPVMMMMLRFVVNMEEKEGRMFP